jgi:hypothetical protein
VDLDEAVRAYKKATASVERTRKAAQRRIADARGRADEARVVLAAAMVDAALRGVRPVEIERRTGYTKERVRQILRAGGVEPD